MSSRKRPRLSAAVALTDRRLALTFCDSRQVTVDLSCDIQTYPGLASLLDPIVFATARLADNGWTVEWLAADIQIGADTLYRDAFRL